MAIIRAAPGEVVNARVQFTDDDDDPIIDITGIVQYRVYSPDGRTLVRSAATVDPADSSIYTASFTMPANTPVSENGEKAKFVMVGTDSEGNKYQHKEWFDVIGAGDDTVMANRRHVVTTQTTGFSTTFSLPADVDVDSVTFTLYNDNSEPMVVRADPPSTIVGGNRIYKTTFPKGHGYPPSSSISGAYLGEWRAEGGDLEDDEVETVNVYILNPQAMLLMDDMRAMLDKGDLRNIHPYLSWNAETFIQHLNEGFEYVNGAPTTTTNFSINRPLPVGLTRFIKIAAELSALRAQYLAESQTSNINFQGLGVQLDIDRLTGLQTLMDQLNAELEKLPDWKKNWIQSGSPVGNTNSAGSRKQPLASGIVISEATNYANPWVYDEGLSLLGGRRGQYIRRRSRL